MNSSTFSSAKTAIINDFLLQDAPVVFLELSRDGVIQSAGRFTERLVGKSPEGTAFQDIIVDFNQTFTLSTALIQQDPMLLDLNVPGSLPRSFLFHFHVVEKSILVFGVSDDEELEQLRTELLCSNQELNNLTRTLHKQNAQLAHLNTLKNQFLGIASHDIRKPISIILNYTEFLQEEIEDLLDEEQQLFLKKIEESAQFMKRMVDDFLDVSIIESGGFTLNRSPVYLPDLVARSVTLPAMSAEKKDVLLEVNAVDDIPLLQLDEDKIGQALTNVIGNAVEHSYPGKRVMVRLYDSEDHVTCEIEDQGAGMEEEEHQNIFLPFKKGSSKKTGGEKSTGLGLAITKKIIDSHSGVIEVVSEVGKGTLFSIKLPKK